MRLSPRGWGLVSWCGWWRAAATVPEQTGPAPRGQRRILEVRPAPPSFGPTLLSLPPECRTPYSPLSDLEPTNVKKGFPGATSGEEPSLLMQETWETQVQSLVSGRSRGGEHGNPLQYSHLENPMDRGAWQTTVHSVLKNQTRLSNWACMHSHLSDWIERHTCSTRTVLLT